MNQNDVTTDDVTVEQFCVIVQMTLKSVEMGCFIVCHNALY